MTSLLTVRDIRWVDEWSMLEVREVLIQLDTVLSDTPLLQRYER
jgi:hypothetical protein